MTMSLLGTSLPLFEYIVTMVFHTHLNDNIRNTSLNINIASYKQDANHTPRQNIAL